MSGETERVYKSRTLAEWCSAHSEPYTLLKAGGELVGRIPSGIERQFIPAISPPIFYGRLADTVILPSRSFNCTSDGALIYTGLSHRDYAAAEDLEKYFVKERPAGQFRLRIPNEMPTVEQECIFLGGRNNFGHLLFENLIRWAVAVHIPGSELLPVAVYGGLPSRFYEFFDLIGLPEKRRILIDPAVPTRFNRVWRVSSPMYAGGTSTNKTIYWWAEGVHFLHNQVRSRALEPGSTLATGARPILYVTRGHDGWRRILNEAEVIECAKRYGAEPVSFAGLSAKDQVRLVGNARAMILPVGAGSAISAFAPRDCALVELVPPSITAFFGAMGFAGCLGQRHFRVHGRNATREEVLAAGLTIKSKIPIDQDYWIKSAHLDATLKVALAQ